MSVDLPSDGLSTLCSRGQLFYNKLQKGPQEREDCDPFATWGHAIFKILPLMTGIKEKHDVDILHAISTVLVEAEVIGTPEDVFVHQQIYIMQLAQKTLIKLGIEFNFDSVFAAMIEEG